tara:strand:- start:2328 stop:2564 length:237 start_codon:yes stop_codon:yes gene_type:complete
MNHAEYVFSDAHQGNLKRMRTKAEGLAAFAQTVSRYAKATELDHVLHYLPRLIAGYEELLTYTEHIKQNLNDVWEASE